jgi:hypothetical protein
MLDISQEISRDFTPCFSSQPLLSAGTIRLAPKELLDISEKISHDFAPTVPLSTIPELMLLPVDPEHLYAYWHLGDARNIPSADSDQLTLRIYPLSNGESASWFDVALDSPKTQQQILLPDVANETVYSAAIGIGGGDGSFIEVAHSNIVHTPHGQTSRRQQDRQNLSHNLGKNASGQGIN